MASETDTELQEVRSTSRIAGANSPIGLALGSLSDRSVRRILGARAYLRGVEYVRRRAVVDLELDDKLARGHVRGSAPMPYQVRILATADGFSSQCNCSAFAKIEAHCKHVAALLLALREQLRAPARSGESAFDLGQGDDLSSQFSRSGRGESGRARRGDVRGDTPARADSFGDSRRAKTASTEGRLAPGITTGLAHRRDDPSKELGHSRGLRGRSGLPRRVDHHIESGPVERPFQNTPLDDWLPEGLSPKLPQDLEFRIAVRPSALFVTVFDPALRASVSPTDAFAERVATTSGDRPALRMLSRIERGSQPRGMELRGEDAAEFLESLSRVSGRRVLLEPALMHVRFSEDPLRLRFDLELPKSRGAETDENLIVRACFERKRDGLRILLNQGAWFEGAPGYHLDTTEGVVRPLDPLVTSSWLARIWRTPEIRFPLSNLPFLLSEVMPKLTSEVGAELPNIDAVAEEVEVPPHFSMRAFGELVETRVQLSATYNETEIEIRADGMTPPILVLPPKGPGQKAQVVRVDVLAQQEAVGLLKDMGFVADEDGQALVCRGDDAIQFWTEGLGSLPEEWEYFVPDELVGLQLRNEEVGARARVSSGMDWLGLKVTFLAGGVLVPAEELARCLSEGRKYVKLEDGSFAKLDPAKVREILARQAEILSSAKNGKIPLSQAGRIHDLLGQVKDSQVGAEAKTLFEKLQNFESIEIIKKPRNLKATLRPYQEQALSWLYFLHELGSGGVLADDMGLGKTLETIALLLTLKNERKKREEAGQESGRHLNLIVAPTSVVPNWLREIEKFAPSLKAMAWHGSDRHERVDEIQDHDVVVTSYALLRRDEDQLRKLPLQYLILDEAQAIKNPMSATARSAKAHQAHRRLALSGTPIENRLSEIWSIFDFVSPGLLGELPRFEQRYSGPIDKGDSKAAARLRATIHPFVLRRTKAEVAKDLPEKIEVAQTVELAPEQAKLYGQVLAEVRASVLGEVDRVGLAKSHIQILAALTRLRQVACDPRLLGLPRTFGDEDSGKLRALRDLVDEAREGGHRVLVFSQFVTMLTIIRKALDEDGIKYEYLDGSTKDRQERVERFQSDPTLTVFLISLKAGGTGLNLTGADTVVHFDPWWNPAVEDQATDRAHRIGQHKVVNVYKLVAKDTIEEKILQLAAKKRTLVDTVLMEDAGGEKKLTRADLDDLFG